MWREPSSKYRSCLVSVFGFTLTLLIALHLVRLCIILHAPEQRIATVSTSTSNSTTTNSTSGLPAPADRVPVTASLRNFVQLVKLAARHVRTADAALLHQHATARRRHRQIRADAQRANQVAVAALALQARLDGGHQRAVMEHGAVVVAACSDSRTI